MYVILTALISILKKESEDEDVYDEITGELIKGLLKIWCI